MPRLKQTGKPPGTNIGQRPIYRWFERRLQVETFVKQEALHPVPARTASWWYVFGSAAFTLLFFQVFTGILLALVYAPTAGQAWNSLNILNHQVALGWYIRALHGWGSNFMVAIVLIHMAQVFLFGAYKYPRELTWIVGVFLLLMTLGMAFTGQVLRFDQNSYWGLGIGASIVSRVPFIGGPLVHLLLGGPIIAGDTLTRFFDLHVFIIPGLLILFALVHVWMVLKLGINEWPMPGRLVRRAAYAKEYEELVHKDGMPFIPGAFWRDLVFSGAIVAAVVVCAWVLGPFGPNGQPDPSIIQTVPKPDFFFLWIYAILAYLPPDMETPFILIAPIVAIAALLALPFFAGEGEKSWHRRPVAILLVSAVAIGFGTLTHLGTTTPWSPHMDAWSSDPIPASILRADTPLERQGAVVFQDKQCRNCHSIGGSGGERGPALDSVATRMTPDQLRYKVTTGGGNMPAYGKNLSPPQIEALVSFLDTLHPANERPAFDAAQQAIQKAEAAAAPAANADLPANKNTGTLPRKAGEK
ncbi:MAG: cytochrome b N-terminal domain-containing protein [Terracidiphilus sp.]